MDAREACDDGNGAGGDGCEPDCSVTKGWNCTTAGADCGLEVRPEEVGDRLCGPSACVYVPVCGDGARNLEGEECDDGNERGGDGCAHNCTVELSWRCDVARSGRDQCSPVVVTDRSRFDHALCPVCGDPAWSRCVLYGGEGKCRCGPGFVKSGFTRASGGAEGCPASGSDCDPAGYTNPFLTTAEVAFPTPSPRSTAQEAPEPCSDSTPRRPVHRKAASAPAAPSSPARRLYAQVFAGLNPCEELDECSLEGVATCDASALCIDTPGSFECACAPGFAFREGSATACDDVDECSARPCAPNATCRNAPGSFECTCAPRFAGDGLGRSGCVYTDECMDGTHACGAGTRCALRPRLGYDCPCAPGFARRVGGAGGACFPPGFEDARAEALAWLPPREPTPGLSGGLLRAWPVPYLAPASAAVATWAVARGDGGGHVAMLNAAGAARGARRVQLRCASPHCGMDELLAGARGVLQQDMGEARPNPRPCPRAAALRRRGHGAVAR